MRKLYLQICRSMLYILAAAGLGILAAPPAEAAIIINAAPGYSISLVSEGGTMDSANIALASNGSTAFAESEYGAPHFTSNLNDGLYGNSESWLRNMAVVYGGGEGNYNESWAGIDLPGTDGTTYALSQVAWGRANDGGFTERWAGIYTLQFTTDATVDYSANGGNWTTIGTIELQGPATVGYSPWLRHLYDISTSTNQPIAATGFRLAIDNASNGDQVSIDELELYPIPEPATLGLLVMGGVVAIRRRRAA